MTLPRRLARLAADIARDAVADRVLLARIAAGTTAILGYAALADWIVGAGPLH